MVAFIFSLIVTAAMTGGVIWYGKRRPADAYLTWGDAIRGATYVFFMFFLVYGIVPHQFIVWADGELNWRADSLIVGWGPLGFIGDLPFDISWQTVRDVLVTVIYFVMATGNMVLWSWWQKRGQKKDESPELEESTYGRPLVKQEA